MLKLCLVWIWHGRARDDFMVFFARDYWNLLSWDKEVCAHGIIWQGWGGAIPGPPGMVWIHMENEWVSRIICKLHIPRGRREVRAGEWGGIYVSFRKENLCGASYVVQSMWQELAYSSMWCELRGVSYVVQSMWYELTYSSMWFELCGVSYEVQYLRCHLCGAIYVVVAMRCYLCV